MGFKKEMSEILITNEAASEFTKQFIYINLLPI